MRKKKRRLIAVIVLIAVLGALVGGLYAAGIIGSLRASLPPLEPVEAQAAGEEIPFGNEEWIQVGRTDTLALFMRSSDGNFYVETASGEQWYANPLDAMDDAYATRVYRMELASSLIINYYDLQDKQTVKKNSEAVCVKKKSIAFYRLENGFLAEYTFGDAGITIPVEVALEGEQLCARIVTSQIVETNPERYLLASIRLLPNFASGGAEDDGYLFVPDGEGALMYFNNGKGNMSEYQAYVYGDNLTTTNLFRPADAYRASLPVFGIRRNGSAMLSVITGGAGISRLTAVPSLRNSTYCSVFAEYLLRFNDKYVLDESSLTAQSITLYQQGEMETNCCEQYYCFLEGEQADWAGMAACYREYLITEESLAPRSPDQTALFLDFYGAVSRKESIVGIPITVQRRLSDLETVKATYQSLRKELEGKLRVRMLSWSVDGLKGKVDTSPAWAAGNSWRAWEALQTEMAGQGDTATLALELTLFSASGNGYSTTRDSSQSLSESPAFQYRYLITTRMRDMQAKRSYLLHPALLNRAVDQASSALQKHGVESVSPLTMASVRYGSYGDSFAGTEQTIVAIRQALQKLNDARDCVLDDVNAFALPMADYVVNLPEGSSRFDAMDASVPFLQMVCGGLTVGYAGQPINLSETPKKVYLHAIATGEALHFSLITGDAELLIETDLNGLYSAAADVWLPTIAAMTKSAEAARAATAYSRLIAYDTVREGVTLSTFENGAVICVNASNESYAWDGQEVAPMSYLVREATEE